MKKILTIAAILLGFNASFAQTYLYENFNSYDGTSATAPADWYFSTHANYTSNASAGPSTANSYKFGTSGAYIISPMVMQGDSVSFYMKLNGSGNPATDTLSVLEVLGSNSDTSSANFTTLVTYTKISSTMKRYSFARGNAMYIKFVYTKIGGNLAFDDVAFYSGTFVGTTTLNKALSFQVYPNPSTTGTFNLKVEGFANNAAVKVFDIVGKEVFSKELYQPGKVQVDLSSMPKGIYILDIKSDKGNDVRRIRIE